MKTVPLAVPLDFHPRTVFIHVSKEPYEDGEERGVLVHLKGPDNFQFSFYLAGRNSTPEKSNSISAPANPYSPNVVRANRYAGGGALTVEFKHHITTEDGNAPVDTVETPSILQQGKTFTLLPCDNNITLGSPEIASLIKPILYQDNANTLFIEPNVIERTIEEWQDWVTRTPQPEPGWRNPDWWKEFVVIPELPKKLMMPDPIDNGSLINPKPDFDWLLNPGTGLLFDGVLIGPAGRLGLEIRPAEVAGVIAEDGTSVNVKSGSGLASGSTVVLTGATTLKKSGLTQLGSGLNIVGSAGFNSALAGSNAKIRRMS